MTNLNHDGNECETVTHSDALVNCSDAIHLCSANFSHQSA